MDHDDHDRGEVDHPARRVDGRMLALAAAVEALSVGHARVLAAELRAVLEAAQGPAAEVIRIDRDARQGVKR